MDKPPLVSAHLARNLAALRQVRSLTQEALAKAAGVPRSTIANLESGEGNPSLTVLVKVAEALATSIDELLASPRAKVRRWAASDVASRRRGRCLGRLDCQQTRSGLSNRPGLCRPR